MTSFLANLNPRGNSKKVTISEQGLTANTLLLTLDASVRESHANQAETTAHPVENGSNITDHVRRMPEELQIDGVISNKPIKVLASETTRGIKGGPIHTKDADAHAEMRRWQEQGVLLYVSTTLRDYQNMIMTGLSVSRDASSGDILRASLSFKEIVIAQTELADAPEPVKDNDKARTNRGTKAKKNATEEAKAADAETKSTLESTADAVGDLRSKVLDRLANQ